MFDITILDHSQVLFEGKAKSVVLPGGAGYFEILDFHSSIVSLLKKGNILVDDVAFPIAKGVARFRKDKLVAIVER